MSRLGLVALAACAAPRPIPAPPPPVSDLPDLRLPRTFVPSRYDAHLSVDPVAETFHGDMTITGELSDPVNVIWLHAKELEIASAVAYRDGQRVALAIENRPPELVALVPEDWLSTGTWRIELHYRGKVRTDSIGPGASEWPRAMTTIPTRSS